MLCGARLRHTWPGAPGQPVSEFPDDKLCRACVRALGGQAVRAFEHPQPNPRKIIASPTAARFLPDPQVRRRTAAGL